MMKNGENPTHPIRHVFDVAKYEKKKKKKRNTQINDFFSWPSIAFR